MTQKKPSPYGYPVDKTGKQWGPEHLDTDIIPSDEEVARSHSPGWLEGLMEKARAARAKKTRSSGR